MRILVTGHDGFIGSHVFEALLRDGHDVEGVDWPDDLRMIHEVDNSFGAVVNLAAIGGAHRAAMQPTSVVTNNVAATVALRSAIELGRARSDSAMWPTVVQISSFSVYGDAWIPTTEDAPLKPKELYGASKLMQELCWTGYPGSLAILRLSSVYGPWMRLDDPESTVIAKIAKAARDQTEFEVFEDGRQTRDFVHVNDVVAMVRAAISRTVPRVVNVCSGRPVSILEACEILGARVKMTGKYRPGDMRDCLGDASTFTRLCGEPQPFTPLDILCVES